MSIIEDIVEAVIEHWWNTPLAQNKGYRVWQQGDLKSTCYALQIRGWPCFVRVYAQPIVMDVIRLTVNGMKIKLIIDGLNIDPLAYQGIRHQIMSQKWKLADGYSQADLVKLRLYW